jgi:hypothetical protein
MNPQEERIIHIEVPVTRTVTIYEVDGNELLQNISKDGYVTIEEAAKFVPGDDAGGCLIIDISKVEEVTVEEATTFAGFLKSCGSIGSLTPARFLEVFFDFTARVMMEDVDVIFKLNFTWG